MKCRAKIVYYKKLKANGQKRIAYTFKPGATDAEQAWFLNQSPFLYKDADNKFDIFARNGEMYECQGKVTAEIVAEDEPYMGGSSASLEVIFKCDTCGHTYYPNLPTKYTINEWVNGILDKLP